MRSIWLCLWSLALCPLLTSCSSLPAVDNARSGPFFTPQNVQAASRMPVEIRRVVVIPVADDGKIAEDTLNAIDETIQTALNRAQRFEVVPISRTTCAQLTGTRRLLSFDALPHDLFSRLIANYAADAVLFVDITAYSAYPPLVLGLRGKLVRTDNSAILWAFDTVFSAQNPTIANSARHHWLNTAPPGTSADFSLTALESPRRFADYAASAAFATLPRR